MELTINTNVVVKHPTTLKKSQVNALKHKVDMFDYDAPRELQYNSIESLLTELDAAGMTNEADLMNLSSMKAVLEKIKEGARGSKPSEFINIIESILDNILPYAASGGGRRRTRRRRRHSRKTRCKKMNTIICV